MKRLSVALLITLVAPSLALAGMDGSVSAEFKVKATVDSFTGTALSEPFAVETDDKLVTVTFDILKMETGKKKRDIEMQHMFHADEFPQITGIASQAALLALDPQAEIAELPLDVMMHGLTRNVSATVSNVTRSESGVSFDLAFPLVLSEFDLKPPSIMKIIKVADTVQVSAKVNLSDSTD